MLIPDAPPLGEMSEGMKNIPEATYELRVHKAEYIAIPKTKDAKGPYIKAQLVVTGPAVFSDPTTDTTIANPHIGRFVFMNYSLTGDGAFRLRELLTVTGHPAEFKLVDDQQIVGLEFKGAVIIKAGTGGYDDKNEVKKHMPLAA